MMISGFQPLRQARAQVAVLEAPTEESLQSSGRARYLLCHQHPAQNHGRQRRLIASVTSQQSRLTRVATGLNIDGRLEAGLATLRLELTKQDDCLANFICQSLAEDVEGNQFESSAQVLQHPQQSIESGGDNPLKSVPVLALMQQLDTKFERLESDMDSLKHSIDHDVESIKADLNSKVDRLEDKIQSIAKDLITQSNRLEDKIESQQKDSNSKIERFEEKAESFNDRMADKIESFKSYLRDDLKDKLDSYADGLDFEEELKAAFTDALTPKACYKDMLSVTATKPYIVIEANDKNKQAFPILCDTTTDGGGWIVIQRRHYWISQLLPRLGRLQEGFWFAGRRFLAWE
ncbi:repeat motif-containing protein [Plakobranchus ocellatus]|uniref:Repeat motif-containing protein n=1 Tax=Plakobranchus ocellatus TaxID=259542 RepID=A0AAV4DUC6_9GAST|nr:repeat motif-containing protein [Plakobranchus ocellatus]